MECRGNWKEEEEGALPSATTLSSHETPPPRAGCLGAPAPWSWLACCSWLPPSGCCFFFSVSCFLFRCCTCLSRSSGFNRGCVFPRERAGCEAGRARLSKLRGLAAVGAEEEVGEGVDAGDAGSVFENLSFLCQLSSQACGER